MGQCRSPLGELPQARQVLLPALPILDTLALPRHEASGVEVVFVQFGNFAVVHELGL